MEYKETKNLREGEWKRIIGVKEKTFRLMVERVKDHEIKIKKKIGGPTRLCLEDQVLLWLEYMKDYPTQIVLARCRGISEATANRYIRKIEDILKECHEFKLPKKEDIKKIWKNDNS